jgi:CheY-like chemotaxis protein
MRVLIVEDDDDTRLLFRTMLESLGHDVLEADNGRRGIEIALKENPELIVMDIRMPGVDGYLGVGALRAIQGFQTLPIVAITADYSSQTKERAIAAGFNECIGKPITRDDLERIITRYSQPPHDRIARIFRDSEHS